MENIIKYKKQDDGRMAEDRTVESTAADGLAKIVVKETWEQAIPMELKKRISSKIIEVPVEVRIEHLDSAGNVTYENVEVIPSDSLALRSEKEAVTLGDLQQQLASIAAKLQPSVTTQIATESKNLKAVLAEKYVDDTSEVGSSTGGTIASIIMLVGVAAASALFIYNFLF